MKHIKKYKLYDHLYALSNLRASNGQIEAFMDKLEQQGYTNIIKRLRKMLILSNKKGKMIRIIYNNNDFEIESINQILNSFDIYKKP